MRWNVVHEGQLPGVSSNREKMNSIHNKNLEGGRGCKKDLINLLALPAMCRGGASDRRAAGRAFQLLRLDFGYALGRSPWRILRYSGVSSFARCVNAPRSGRGALIRALTKVYE